MTVVDLLDVRTIGFEKIWIWIRTAFEFLWNSEDIPWHRKKRIFQDQPTYRRGLSSVVIE